MESLVTDNSALLTKMEVMEKDNTVMKKAIQVLTIQRDKLQVQLDDSKDLRSRDHEELTFQKVQLSQKDQDLAEIRSTLRKL